MKNRAVKTLIAVTAMVLLCAGCGAENEAAAVPEPGDGGQAEPAAEVPSQEELPEEEEPSAEESGAETEEAISSQAAYEDPDSLPAYSYQGGEEYLDVISDYLVQYAKEGLTGDLPDVFIPFSIIVQTDDTNPEDIIAYGSYNIDGYDLYNTTLISHTGSRSFGAIHLKKNADGSCEVTDADLPLVEEECREVFAPVDGLYEKVMEVSDGKTDEARAEAIAEYVNTNGLNITQWQDYSHPPVPVLNAPETPEEAELYLYKSPQGYQLTYDLRELTLIASDYDDMFSKIEDPDVWSGTLMVVKKVQEEDADAAITAALADTDAGKVTGEDAVMGGSIPCRRAAYDNKLEDGRIFRYVCYAVPASDGMMTVLIETTYEKGVSELSTEELEKTFETVLSTFSV